MTTEVPNLRPRLRRFFRNVCERLSIAIPIVAAVIGLTFLHFSGARPARTRYAPNSGITVRREVVRVWVPKGLAALRSREIEVLVANDRPDVRSFLEHHGLQNVWYALTVRHHQIDGGAAAITYVRRPYNQPECFNELIELLAFLTDQRPRPNVSEFSGAAIHILADDFSAWESREILDAL